MEFDSKQIETLQIVTHVSSSLSIVGSLFIIISYVVFPTMRRVHSTIIFFLSFCDLFSSLAWSVIPVSLSDNWCLAQAIIVQFFQIASFIWTGAIAVSLYLVLVKKKVEFSFEHRIFHLVSWLSAAINVSIGYFAGIFGNANADVTDKNPSWCWIKYQENFYKLGLYFIPFFIIWIFNLFIYIRVSKEIVKIKSTSIREIAETKIRIYLLVFMFCVSVGAINRMQNWIDPKSPQYWLYFCDALVSPLQGFLNSIIYGMNKQLRIKWLTLLHNCSSPKENPYQPTFINNSQEKENLLRKTNNIQIDF